MSALKSKLGYSSPFDEALSKPLISGDAGNQRSATHTSASQTSSSARSVYSSKLDMMQPSSDASMTVGAKYQSRASNLNYKPPLPNDNGDSFLLNEADRSDTDQQNDSSLTATNTYLELDQVDIDAALLRERHAESASVAMSMRQIHEINQDLANLVQSHQETIDHVESDAYEIHDNAERGVSHLEKAKAAMKDGMRNEGFMRVFFAVMATGGLMIAIVLLLEAFN